jgi:DNA-binding CsgD family transcriptional regulator
MIDACAPVWPCILLDGQLAVAQLNPAARHLLATNEAQLCLRQQRLHAPGDPLALGRSLAAAARGERSALALARPGRPALTLLAEPLPTDGLAWVRLMLRDPELEVPDPRLLQSLFGFTPTEAVVAAGLAQGMDSAELARSLGVQPNTVHSHIKRVLVKSGARRQSRLVSLILRSVAMSPHPLPAGAAGLQGPGLAQTGNDAGQGAGHSPPQSRPAACGCL